ncbi:hypothetical protein [Pararhodobacter sp.]|uniref:hypothetical protein n=1 Tax=Pararhodobacter sp. TaxID=2127056 RepID=UPI002FDD8890
MTDTSKQTEAGSIEENREAAETDWIQRYVDYTLKTCGFTHFDDGASVVEYAREMAAIAWADSDYRDDGPEACADGDMEYWGED